MEEGEKKPDAGTVSGGPQKKIVYALIVVAVVILAVVVIAKFGFNMDLLSPAAGEMSLVQRQSTVNREFAKTTIERTAFSANVTSQELSLVANSLSNSPKASVTLVHGVIGSICNSDSACYDGNCVDGVCCDHKCEGNCHYCAFPGHEGTCMDVPDWQDPRRACPMASGGTKECGASCYSGQCTFPDLGTPCGLCETCDGNGRCDKMPVDDSRCGVIPCVQLSSACRVYEDLKSGRCASLGSCKVVSTADCVQFTDLTCAIH
jgi:hypothetical protein